jgi:hypothetical protein
MQRKVVPPIARPMLTALMPVLAVVSLCSIGVARA